MFCRWSHVKGFFKHKFVIAHAIKLWAFIWSHRSFIQNVLQKDYRLFCSVFLLLLCSWTFLSAVYWIFWFSFLQPRSDRPGDQVVVHSWWNSLLCSQMLVSSVMFIIQLPNVRVRLWHLWVKRRKRGRSGKLGGKSWLCFRTAKKGNLAVFFTSVYPSLNKFRISEKLSTKTKEEKSRMNGKEEERSIPKTTFQCWKAYWSLNLLEL